MPESQVSVVYYSASIVIMERIIFALGTNLVLSY